MPFTHSMTSELEALLVYTRDVAGKTPMTWLRETKRLAYHVLGGAPTIPRLLTVGRGIDTVIIDSQRFTLQSFRAMVSTLEVDALHLMYHDVLRGMSTAWLDIDAIYDDLNSRELDYSFATDPKNDNFQRHQDDLYDHLTRHAEFIRATCGRTIYWNTVNLEAWISKCSELHGALFLLLHMTSGMPARGGEYPSYLIRNTSDGQRAFFVTDGQVMTVQTYHKTSSRNRRIVPRFIPPRLGHLFVKYLAIVRPMMSFVAEILWGTQVSQQYKNVWAISMGRLQESRHVSAILSSAFSRHCDVDFGLNEYRHLAKFYANSLRSLGIYLFIPFHKLMISFDR